MIYRVNIRIKAGVESRPPSRPVSSSVVVELFAFSCILESLPMSRRAVVLILDAQSETEAPLQA